VKSAKGNGIVVVDGPATLQDVTVTDAEGIGILANCAGEGCATDASRITGRRLKVTSSRAGIWARGTYLDLEGGAFDQNHSTNASSGFGVIASGGALLSAGGTRVCGNDLAGVVVDGPDTQAVLTDVTVCDNIAQGIWAQSLSGSLEAPALKVDGSDTAITGNGLAGLGAVDSVGIIFVMGRVADTRRVPVVFGPDTEELADGVGLFGGTGQVELDDLDLENNDRAQLLVDQGGVGIIFVMGRVVANEGQYKVVIQNTGEDVEVDPSLVSTLSGPLPVSTETYNLGAVADPP
jgi:hypothetical protein